MKKQLLIVLVALLAIGLNSTFGQTVTCPDPRVDPTCIPGDALHPAAGIPYTYEVLVPTPPGTQEFTWFATQEDNFIAGGVLTPIRETLPGSTLILATGAGYNDPATGTNTVSITWNSYLYDPLNPVFVVIQVKVDAGAGGCVTQNMKVFKIEPINFFTLDIQNVNAAGVAQAYDTPIDRCIHDIVTATYDATPPEGVIYDFGVDYLYYVVTAAKFSTSWLPSVKLTGVDAQETITAVEWARPNDFAFALPNQMPLTATPGVYTSTDPVLVVDPSGTVGTAGECIIIRVTVDHSNGVGFQYQGLTDEQITLAVDGVTNLIGTPLPDVHYTNPGCGLADGFDNDIAVQTIKARPDITAPAMPAPGLLPVK